MAKLIYFDRNTVAGKRYIAAAQKHIAQSPFYSSLTGMDCTVAKAEDVLLLAEFFANQKGYTFYDKQNDETYSPVVEINFI